MKHSGNALLRAKVWFATYYFSLGLISPFWNVLLQRFGYRPALIGIVSLLRPFVGAVSGPTWAGLADHLGAHRTIFLCLTVAATLLRTSFAVHATPFAYLLLIFVLLECTNGPVAVLADTAIVAAGRDDGDYGLCRMWACLGWGIAGVSSAVLLRFVADPRILFAVYGVCACCAFVFAVALDFSHITVTPPLGRGDSASLPSNHFENSRLDAAEAGFPPIAGAPMEGLLEPLLPPAPGAITAHAVGVSAEHSELSVDTGTASDAALHSGRGREGVAEASAAVVAETAHFMRRACALVFNREMLVFLGKALIMGVCVGAIDGFLFIFLVDLGAPMTLPGAMLAMICAIELPVFTYSGLLLNKLGYDRSIDVALAAFCLRLAAYSLLPLLPRLWLIVPVESLHGVTFGIAWTAGVNYCKKVAPEGLVSTAQGVYSGTYFGLGRGLGGLAGGLLYQAYGGAVMFRLTLAFAAASWALVAFGSCASRPRQAAR